MLRITVKLQQKYGPEKNGKESKLKPAVDSPFFTPSAFRKGFDKKASQFRLPRF